MIAVGMLELLLAVDPRWLVGTFAVRGGKITCPAPVAWYLN